MRLLEIEAGGHAYQALVGPLEQARERLRALSRGRPLTAVTDETIWALHGERLSQVHAVEPLFVPAGEAAKSWANLEALLRSFAERGLTRSTPVLAFGGGSVGDLTGVATGLFKRGCPVVHIPTTFLAQVDSAVGGKTGINTKLGKNLIGAFHQPRLVAADPRLLTTLSRREFRAGLYEVVKYGMAFEAPLFAQVRANLRPILERDIEALTPIIAESCRIKAGVVMQDERERGPRRLLNFGHTAGHAFEAVTKYRRFRHGEAIAWGMLVAAELSVARQALPSSGFRALSGLITSLGPLPPVSDLKIRDVLAAVRRDKKIVDGKLHFVIVTDVGHAQIVDDVTEDELKRALAAVGLKK